MCFEIKNCIFSCSVERRASHELVLHKVFGGENRHAKCHFSQKCGAGQNEPLSIWMMSTTEVAMRKEEEQREDGRLSESEMLINY